MKFSKAQQQVLVEYGKFNDGEVPFNDLYQAYAWLQESLDSLWAAIKNDDCEKGKGRSEARKQAAELGARALSLMVDCL